MRISIVALNALPALEPSLGKGIGGLETFAWRLARGIARQPSNTVQFVVRSPARRKSIFLQQVQVDCVYEPFRDVRQSVSKALELDRKSRRPRIKQWRAPLVWQVPLLALNKLLMPPYSEQQAMENAIAKFRPDLILTLGVNRTSAQLGKIAESMGVSIVLWLQSNADLDERFFLDDAFVDQYGVSSSDARNCFRVCKHVICQTQTQHVKLREIEKRMATSSRPASTVIVNPIDHVGSLGTLPGFPEREGVLWIGRADRFHKRPLLALDISELCPEVPWTMVVNPGEEQVHSEIQKRAGPNVKIESYVPAEKMRSRMSQARIFLSTGSAAYEGFPNVLLESCACGTPIVSLDDFDGFIERSHGGICSQGKIQQAANQIRLLNSDSHQWNYHSRCGHAYVQEFHDLDQTVKQFLEWSQDLTKH